jgi:hypothetical protein
VMLVQISVDPVALHQHRPARQSGLTCPANLCQRDFGLSLENNFLRNSYLAPRSPGVRRRHFIQLSG